MRDLIKHDALFCSVFTLRELAILIYFFKLLTVYSLLFSLLLGGAKIAGKFNDILRQDDYYKRQIFLAYVQSLLFIRLLSPRRAHARNVSFSKLTTAVNLPLSISR